MIDLNSILVGTRQYLLNELDGLPEAFKESSNKTQLVAACQKVVEGDLLENSELDDLGFLKAYFKASGEQNDRVTPYFSRLLLLKFLYEETIKDTDLIKDKNWFKEMRDKLNAEFEHLKNGLASIKINDRVILSLADLTALRNEARANQQPYYNFRPIFYSLGALYVAARISGSRAFLYLLAAAVIVSSIYYMGLQERRIESSATFFQANRAQQQLEQARGGNIAEHNEGIMSNQNIKKFFLLSDDDLIVMSKGPGLR